jgi:23S rRNA pseudouridine1911/1915/1917 synthase
MSLTSPAPILYEDNHVLVVVKPEGLASQADDSGEPDLLSLLKAFIKERDQKPGNVYLGLIHRLDRPVGGVVVFAKTSKAGSRLSDALRKLQFHKTYRAVVNGKAPESLQLVNHLIKNPDLNKVRVVEEDELGGKVARLSAQRIAYNNDQDLSLLEITLETGRSHQIRVQLSHNGFPIVGDQKYGGRKAPNIALHAVKLAFPHPVKDAVLTFESSPPSRFPWNQF